MIWIIEMWYLLHKTIKEFEFMVQHPTQWQNACIIYEVEYPEWFWELKCPSDEKKVEE